MATHESRGKPRIVPTPVWGSTPIRWIESPLLLRMSCPGRASEPMASTQTRLVGTSTDDVNGMASP